MTISNMEEQIEVFTEEVLKVAVRYWVLKLSALKIIFFSVTIIRVIRVIKKIDDSFVD